MDKQLVLVTELPRTVHICIPPELEAEAKALAAESPPIHPAWSKGHRRGRHFVISTNELDDISEIADFARCYIEEPPSEGLSKSKRQALQILLDRTYRHAELIPVGSCHALAIKWREQPLGNNATARIFKKQKKS